jgi:hypothetical protein
MKKLFKTLPLLLVASISACDIAHQYRQDTLFLFDTVVTVKTTEYHGLMYNVVAQEHTCDILKEVDAISDAYKKRDVTCIYDLNNTNDKIEMKSTIVIVPIQLFPNNGIHVLQCISQKNI